MLVVADVNISQDEVAFLRGIETVERVVYIAQDLRRSMPDSEIVEYALECKGPSDTSTSRHSERQKYLFPYSHSRASSAFSLLVYLAGIDGDFQRPCVCTACSGAPLRVILIASPTRPE